MLANVLSFTCERTWQISDAVTIVGAFVSCNGGLASTCAISNTSRDVHEIGRQRHRRNYM